MVHPLAQAHILKKIRGRRFGIPVRTAGYECRNHHVLQGVELRQQMMELEYESDFLVAEGCQLAFAEGRDVGAVNEHPAAVGTVERAEYL